MTLSRCPTVRVFAIAFLLILASTFLSAQGTDARITGIVTDPSKALIRGAKVTAISTDTGVQYAGSTNSSGIYSITALPAGHYRLEVENRGFKSVVMPGVTLHVQDVDEINFEMALGSMSETVTVASDSVSLNTTNATVSTVIDRQLIENMPLNGRDMQTLFELSPGTMLNAGGTPNNGGGFSVDGQRPTANYLTIDGASGNAYTTLNTGNQNATGATIATSASGGTNGILPIDAIEEYRMDTSTYTAENGRTPGGQIQVRTRSGTNEFHGTLFEDFRNQVLDATDWFVKYNHLKQSQLRMNDFGGTLGGPALKNKMFFFVAHDTLLLNQPNTVTQTDVPNQSLRQSASPLFEPMLAVFPNGNGGPDPSLPGFDFYSQSFPYVIRTHTTSIRLDGQFPRSIHGFFRANIAPSSSENQSFLVSKAQVNIYTYTGGLTIPISHNVVDEMTINRTGNASTYSNSAGSAGGNSPNALQDNLPSGVNLNTSNFNLYMNPNYSASVATGAATQNSLVQWNVLDSLSWQLGKHALKFGGDFLTKQSTIRSWDLQYIVLLAGESKPPYVDLQNGLVNVFSYAKHVGQPVVALKNTSLYANDSWRANSRLTLNVGLRWEFNPAPSVGPLGVFALQGSSFDVSKITASVTTDPIYAPVYSNLAPRLGFAWSLFGQGNFGSVLRGGVGTYFDTGQAATIGQAAADSYPYQSNSPSYKDVPYQSIDWSGPNTVPISLPLTSPSANFIDNQLRSPRTYEWSLTFEQQLGKGSKLSTSYVGNDGEQLIGAEVYYNKPNAQGQYPVDTSVVAKNGTMTFFTNRSHSNYQALQMQFSGQIGRKLNTVASYTWAHAEDNGSTEYSTVGATAYNPMANSAFDLRHIFAAAIHYAPSGISANRFLHTVTDGWGFDTIARLQGALPFTVTSATVPGSTAFLANADTVPGQPVVLHQHYDSFGKVVPGNKLLNYSAFAAPPKDASGNPLRQGNSTVNGYRIFGLTQWDLSASRSWMVWERINLNFRVDAFNLLNSANFANVGTSWSATNASTFGRASNTYSAAYGSVPSNHGQSGSQLAVFQNGGPRSLQLSLKLKF